MKIFYKVRIIFIFLLFTSAGRAQQIDVSYFRTLYTKNLNSMEGLMYEKEAVQKSKTGDSYHFMALRRAVGGINAIVSKTQDDFFIAKQIQLIDIIIGTSKQSKLLKGAKSDFSDNYLGWLDNSFKEVPLYESYVFLYITQFLYLLQESHWMEKSSANNAWWSETLNFIEVNLWEKWYTRSKRKYENDYGYFLRERTHMGSHWAGIAMYLNAMTKNQEIKKQAEILLKDYNKLLKRNFKIKDNCYVWNSTYDNISGSLAPKRKQVSIQDVSHGNHVVAYILNAYEMGSDIWTLEDIKYLANTLKYKIYNQKKNRFYNAVDGSGKVGNPGLGDAWIRLSEYDKEVMKIFKLYTTEHGFKRNQLTFQYVVNMRLAI